MIISLDSDPNLIINLIITIWIQKQSCTWKLWIHDIVRYLVTYKKDVTTIQPRCYFLCRSWSTPWHQYSRLMYYLLRERIWTTYMYVSSLERIKIWVSCWNLLSRQTWLQHLIAKIWFLHKTYTHGFMVLKWSFCWYQCIFFSSYHDYCSCNHTKMFAEQQKLWNDEKWF